MHEQYADALPILSKYALMGDVRAQSGIGDMYYAGLGVTPDRDEAIRWFRLAAAQGGQAEQESLAAALDGSWKWDGPSPQPSYAATTPVSAQSHSNGLIPFDNGVLPSSHIDQQNTPAALLAVSTPIGPAHEDTGHASNKYLDSLHRDVAPTDPTLTQSDYGSAPGASSSQTVILNRAGGNQYSGNNGDTYTQAGPNGVVNNRTGQFSPTN